MTIKAVILEDIIYSLLDPTKEGWNGEDAVLPKGTIVDLVPDENLCVLPTPELERKEHCVHLLGHQYRILL